MEITINCQAKFAGYNSGKKSDVTVPVFVYKTYGGDTFTVTVGLCKSSTDHTTIFDIGSVSFNRTDYSHDQFTYKQVTLPLSKIS